jgi:hypothetical protein
MSPANLTIAIEVNNIKSLPIDWRYGIPYSENNDYLVSCEQHLTGQSDSDAQLRFDMRQM